MASSRGLADVSSGRRRARLRLLAPVRYLAIQHPEKRLYDFVAPALIAIAMWLIYSMVSPRPAIFGESGVLKFARDLLVMAVPFMIGALATVSMGSPGTFLDRRPVGAELYLDGERLTLRQFVCYLLGYMSFLGIVTLIASVGATLIHDGVLQGIGSKRWLFTLVFNGGTLALFLLLSALLVTVLWSLYFLTEVVNSRRPDQADSSN